MTSFHTPLLLAACFLALPVRPGAADSTGACCLPDGSCHALSPVACVAAGGVFLGAGSDCAAVTCPALVQVEQFTIELSPGSRTLTFDLFDDQGGRRVLRRVSITLDAALCAHVTLENRSPSLPLCDPVISANGLACLNAPAGLSAVIAESGSFAPPPGTCLEPRDPHPGQGPDFLDFGLLCMPGRDTASTDDPRDLARYVGTGTLDAVVDASMLASYPFTRPATYTADYEASGAVTVAYEYELLCPADVNGDGVVDVLDSLRVLSAWGSAGGPEDVNGDGVVNVLDLLEILAAWGACP